MTVVASGSFVFGIVVGWISYRTLRRKKEAVALSDIATVVGAVGGASVTTVLHNDNLFGWYCLGLGVGFFGYLVVAILLARRSSSSGDWLSDDDVFGPPI